MAKANTGKNCLSIFVARIMFRDVSLKVHYRCITKHDFMFVLKNEFVIIL